MKYKFALLILLSLIVFLFSCMFYKEDWNNPFRWTIIILSLINALLIFGLEETKSQ